MVAAAAILAYGCVAPASAPGQADPCAPLSVGGQFAANTYRLGVIDLHFRNAQGAPVTYYECLGGRAHRLGVRASTTGPLTSLMGATFWRCGRLTRHFAATVSAPDGTVVARGLASARTMSCARRFVLDVPRRARRGTLVRVRILDRWMLGAVHARLCVTAPQAARSCRAVALAKAAGSASRRLRLAVTGRWRLRLLVAGYGLGASISVGVRDVPDRARPPTLLATGDSTMQAIDTFLSDDLGHEATVVGDVRPGFAISRDKGWARAAASQVARLRPATTVVSIGGAEGFPMRTAGGVVHDCCDEPWIAEYARRVRAQMLTYRRGARGRVLWLTIPAPRDARAAVLFDAVDRAILRAGEGLARVTILRMDLLFTPDGYRDVIRERGRDVRVREPDGIHLNVSGAAIAARAVVKALHGAG